MMLIVCPRCGHSKLIEIGDGMYSCETCGYTGDTSGKSIFKN